VTGRRRSIRLTGYDYATPAAYFVTICTAGRALPLRLPTFRAAVEEAWVALPRLFRALQLDEMVVMPDHVHCVIALLDGTGCAAQGASRRAPTLADVVRAFKGNTTRQINQLRHAPGAPVWQRNYYEHIVRDEAELDRIREYIRSNPFAEHRHDGEDLKAAWETA
jgi:REP element-mobilizing transposase RayT